MTETRNTTTANPTCTVCAGTGQDAVFGTDCSECWQDARIIDPAELGHGHGHGPSGDGSGHNPTSNEATDRQLAFLGRLLEERQSIDCEAVRAAGHAMQTGRLNKRDASGLIDGLLAVDRPQATLAVRTNRYPGKCGTCGQPVAEETGRIECPDTKWITYHLDGECPAPTAEPVAVEGLDLSLLERFTSNRMVRFAVPGGDTRLKVRVKFAKNGTVYVDDAAEYGYGQKYGSQRPSQSYRGLIQDELAAIVADPQAAIVRYAEITSRCGICNRKLEDGTSVERGIGPVCWRKLQG